MKSKEDFPKPANEQLENKGHSNQDEADEISKRFNKEFNIDVDNDAKNDVATPYDINETWNEKTFKKDKIETDLDFPGSELDVEPENKNK